MKKNTTIILSVIALLFIGSSFSLAQENEKTTKKTPELPGDIVLDFGFNFVESQPDTMDYNWFRSKSIGLYFVKSFDVSKKIEFRPGIGINIDKFGEKGNRHLLNHVQDTAANNLGNYILGYDTIQGDIKKTQFILSTIEIPVEFKFHLGKGDKRDGLFLSVGGSAAYNFESKTKIKYTDVQGNKTKDKKKSDFNQPKLRFGAYGKLGYRGVSLYYKHYFTNMFNEDGPIGSENTRYSTIGISITGL